MKQTAVTLTFKIYTTAKNPLIEIALQGNSTSVVQFVEGEILREEMEEVFWKSAIFFFEFQ